MTTADSGPSPQGANVRMTEAGGSGWIPVQGEGRVGTHDAATPTRILFGQMTSDESCISTKATADGYPVENTGPESLAALRYLGSAGHEDLPMNGRNT